MKTKNINEMDQVTINIYENLKIQVNAVFKHSHECSFKTRETYQERVDMFAKFLAIEYHKKNIKKISNEHLTHYVQYMQKAGLSTSYVTTTMSAIRYFYKKSVGEKFKIKSNRALGVNIRSKKERTGKDRAILDSDYNALLSDTVSSGNKEYEYALRLGLTFGLRIHEFYKFRKSQINQALKSGELLIKGKGGFVRSLPLGMTEIDLLKEVLRQVKSDNDRIFVQKKEKTHRKIEDLQEYIRESRSREDSSYTYHSLRHAYAQKLYRDLLKQGLSEFEARMIVSRRLGHDRIDITETYLEATE